MTLTAKEYLEKLQKNKDFLERKAEQDRRHKQFEMRLAADEEPLITNLARLDIHVNSVWDLVNGPNNYDAAVPVLLRHLNENHHPRTKEGIARALAIPACVDDELVWGELVKHFRKVPPDEAIEDPERRGFRMGLAVALSALADMSRIEELRSLVEDTADGEDKGFIIETIQGLCEK